MKLKVKNMLVRMLDVLYIFCYENLIGKNLELMNLESKTKTHATTFKLLFHLILATPTLENGKVGLSTKEL